MLVFDKRGFCSADAINEDGTSVCDEGPAPWCPVCGTSWSRHPRVPHRSNWMMTTDRSWPSDDNGGWPSTWPPAKRDKHGIPMGRHPFVQPDHNEPPGPGMKWCSKCRLWQAQVEFGGNKTNVDHLQDWCKESVARWWREKRASQPPTGKGYLANDLDSLPW